MKPSTCGAWSLSIRSRTRAQTASISVASTSSTFAVIALLLVEREPTPAGALGRANRACSARDGLRLALPMHAVGGRRLLVRVGALDVEARQAPLEPRRHPPHRRSG